MGALSFNVAVATLKERATVQPDITEGAKPELKTLFA
jgi:hypothetical protein